MISSLSYASYSQLRFRGYIRCYRTFEEKSWKKLQLFISFHFQMPEPLATSLITELFNMKDNDDTPAVVAPDNIDEDNEKTGAPAPASASTNDGKLLLTVIKYDSGTAKLLPGGKLAPTPSQLATSALGIIRAHLSKAGYLEKAE
jgi:hypothetical protein